MRCVFAGTPDVAVPSLAALAASSHELVAVVTRPAAAQGRSSRLTPSPVARWAADHGIPVLTPSKPSDHGFLAELADLAPECCPVVAYGGLLPQAALDIPAGGWVNLHFSLLPAYRGAAPVQRALMDGVTHTGATTFKIVRALDAGPMYRTLTEPVAPLDTAGDLLERLAHAGAELLLDTLSDVAAGVQPVDQPDEGVSLAPKVEVEQVRIDWANDAVTLANLIRGANPDPGAWTTWSGQRFKILLAEPTTEDLGPGALAVTKRDVTVGTGSGSLRLLRVQPPGKQAMVAIDWARGARLGAQESFE